MPPPDTAPSPPDANRKPSFLPIFQTTEWTVVMAAGPTDANSAEALNALCRSYYPALRSYLEHSRYQTGDAEEMLQEFFQYFLDKKIYQDASPERGRFRCFILKALKRFLIDEYHKRQAQKRGGGQELVELDELAEASGSCQDPLSPDIAFDRKWALATIHLAMEQLKTECETMGRGELFHALKARLVDGDDTIVPYAQLAKSTGKSEQSLRVDASRLRQRFHRLLYQTIKRTLLPEVSVEAEMRHLLGCLAAPH